MDSPSAAADVEKALQVLPGVETASVNFASERAKIEYYEDEITKKQLVQTISNSGYKPVLFAFRDRIRNWAWWYVFVYFFVIALLAFPAVVGEFDPLQAIYISIVATLLLAWPRLFAPGSTIMGWSAGLLAVTIWFFFFGIYDIFSALSDIQIEGILGSSKETRLRVLAIISQTILGISALPICLLGIARDKRAFRFQQEQPNS